jgi:hypothetical protein
VRKVASRNVLAVVALSLILPLNSSAQKIKREGSKVGIGVKISSLGAGVEAAIPVFGKLNFRGGFNALNYNHPFHKDGITYDGTLILRSGEASLDWFPFGAFHVSPGVLFYNGNKVTAATSVPGGQSLTLNGISYTSDPNNPFNGTGNVVVWRAAPKITVGFGNLIPRSGRRWSFLGEIGVAYQGAPRSTLAFAGNVCDPSGLNCVNAATDSTVQANIAAEQTKIDHNISSLRFYPIVSVGFGFNF